MLFSAGLIRKKSTNNTEKSEYLKKMVDSTIKKQSLSVNIVKSKALYNSKTMMIGLLNGVGKG